MQLQNEQIQRQTQSQRVAPQLIQANMLLQCSTQELLQVIALEQQQNPALESADSSDDIWVCPHCPPFGLCAQCAARQQNPSEHAEQDNQIDTEPASGDDSAGGADATDESLALRSEWERIRNEPEISLSAGDSDFDPLLLVSAPVELKEELLQQLRARSDNQIEITVAEFLVNSLDEQGYLRIDLEEACQLLHVSCSYVLEGIRKLQACDPPGIGARDLRECLLLQMRARREDGDIAEYDPLAETLLKHHWESLSQRRHLALARSLDISPTRLEEAVNFIRLRLTPHPSSIFRTPWDNCPNTQSASIRPDVIIRRTLSGFVVEVVGLDLLDLQVNSEYRRLYDQIKMERDMPRGGSRRLTNHEKHIVSYVERANTFLRNLQLRRRTILTITEAIISYQHGFLDTGQRQFLRQMTRTKLASELDVHESTVSRALQHKFVQLPSQEVVSFEIFFENAVSIKDTVAELIAGESHDTPLTDQTITKILKDRGHSIARRTVVKYREELRLPASYLRRRR